MLRDRSFVRIKARAVAIALTGQRIKVFAGEDIIPS